MSGAVSGAGKVISTVGKQFVADEKGITLAGPKTIQAIAQGKGLGAGLGAGLKSFFGPGVSLIKDTVHGVMPQQGAPPNIAAEDPAAVAADQKKQQASAARQAQIDAQNNTPNRGGTVLTDNYSYKV